ncbi:host specificity protein J [Xenorhabdus szentirmaii]|uniref:Phage host specificity protein ( phage tail protein) n=1 Tax=Xenorhabdus szentirmaii DSM 16338 TaxID=1427518 RepID=W1IXH4_9GAMM|nr:phage tail protein [Xenorhabdus szentirmaii]PHM33633.1 host specificity protein [Xenorhabdus szentirmaii DSM 16338]PHM42287.1 host specificity protein [Xenorhabdus szentirmaii]CDL83154.1 putative phage host specificity protein (phage tail protein) [Xenorhabdus szentirmaii DSM 16338]
MEKQSIQGNKGGRQHPRTPVEAPDSLQSTSYTKIILALGEGEFAGELDGQRIFLDNTPLSDIHGRPNFEGVKWEFRPGTPHQAYIPGMPAVENARIVSAELVSSWVTTVTNTQLSAVRLRLSWAQLQRQKENGDTVGYRIEYAIDLATDGGAFKEILKTAVDGKTTTKYERSHRVDLPNAHSGWQVRLRRLTPKQNSNRIADAMVVEAITEVIDAKLSYPETALLFVQFDAKQFRNIPQITCEPKMRIIRVPSNYYLEPRRRFYHGSWDGTFKWAWSDNPAWVLYDLMINDRFSIGTRVKAENLALAKWDLYSIAQYCDQTVLDGEGHGEPRFTCNVYIQSQEDAWAVLRDIAGIFRGMTFWSNNNMNVLADMPRDMDYLFTCANVRDGKFTYSSASEKTHYSTAMVSWSDPQNGYQDAIEPVFEPRLIRRYGIRQADITAIGCTRQSEAIRRGKWVLHTNEHDRTVTFIVGLEGHIPLPGYLIGVSDNLLSGSGRSGRIQAMPRRYIITLDRVPSAKVGDWLVINLPSGKAERDLISAINGQEVSVWDRGYAYSDEPEVGSVWAIESSYIAEKPFRVIGIKAGEDGVSFDITAVEHNPDKYALIDKDTRIDERSVTIIPPSVQPAPKNILIDSYYSLNQGIISTTLRITWDAADSAVAYEVEWRKDNGNWITAPQTTARSLEVPNVDDGRYQARVRATNAAAISSIWMNTQDTLLGSRKEVPSAPQSLRTTSLLFGIRLDWDFANPTDVLLKTEICYNKNGEDDDTLQFADISYPQRTHTLQGLAAGEKLYFRARLVDKSGNASEWTSWVSGTASNDNSWIVEASQAHFLDAETGRRLQEQLNEQARSDERHKQAIAEIAQAIERLDDILKDIQWCIR